MMFAFVLVALALFGATVWVALNRPVARDTARTDRASARLLVASMLTLAAGMTYALHSLM